MSSLAQIAAIARRDLGLRLAYPFELVMLFWGVALSVFTFFFIGRLVGDSDALSGLEGGYFAYAVVGVTVMGMSFSIIEVFKNSIRAEQGAGALEILLAGPTPLRTLFAGALVVPVMFATIEALAYAGLGWALAPEALGPMAWLRAAPILVLIMGAFAAMGLWSAAFVVVAQRGDPFAGLFVQASNLVAGALFPVALLPGWLQVTARFIPTFYGFEALRAVMLSDAPWSSVWEELAILAAFDVVLAAIGVVLLRRALRFARTMGTLRKASRSASGPA